EESGLTVPVNAPDAFAAAANRLLKEPGLRVRLSAGAQARAAREVDHRALAARGMDLYRAVLKGRPVVPVYEAGGCMVALASWSRAVAGSSAPMPSSAG